MRQHILAVVLFFTIGICKGQEDVPRLLCGPGDIPPANRVSTTQRVADLRTLLASNNIDAYIVLTNDDHQSEYVSPTDERREYISGFSGSAGWAVITATQQALWTDSRYYLQADQQLDCNWILMRVGTPGVPTMEQWLADKLEAGNIISSDSRTVPHSQWADWMKSFETTGEIVQETAGNFVDQVWGSARPPYSIDPVIPLDEALYTGLTWQQKCTAVAAEVRKAGASVSIVSALDDVAWLLNVRSNDIPFTPVVRSYVTIELNGNGTPSEAMPTVSWFVDSVKLTQEVRDFLGEGSPDGVRIYEYSSFWTSLIDLGNRTSSILMANAFSYSLGSSHAIYSLLPGSKVKFARSVVAVMKSQKNPTESQGMRNSHVRDAAALITFLAKLEAGVKAGESWDELRVVDEVAVMRSRQSFSRGPSFATIAASGYHAAMPHYIPTTDTNSPVNTTAIFKLDSGGQYLDGTTDVTRTMHYGTPTVDQIDTYTRLVAGCAALNMAVFPAGTSSAKLEALVRGPLWSIGRDYGHGTTHGIGYYLAIHEAWDDKFQENFFGSQEPGYYRDGEWGMRLENIVTVVKASFPETTNNKTYYKFDTVTLVPYEPNLLDISLLRPDQVAWLNTYNTRIRAEVRPLLVLQGEQQAIDWLDARTQPFTPICKTEFSDFVKCSLNSC